MTNRADISLDTCRKAFVERDYSRGLAIRFSIDLPKQLDGLIDVDVWEKTIGTINAEFAEADMVGLRSVGETVLSLFSCYISRLFLPSRYQKQLDKIRRYIERQNRSVFIPAGLYLIDPMERGLRVIEVNILSTGKISTATPAWAKCGEDSK